MLSDVTLNVAGHMVTVPDIFLFTGILIAFGLLGLVVAIVGSRRARNRASDAAELLAVQLERIGDTLDRLVKQNAAHDAMLQQQALALASEPSTHGWAAPRRTLADSASPLESPVPAAISYEQFPSEVSAKHEVGVERVSIRDGSGEESYHEPSANHKPRKSAPPIPYSIFGR